jgi:hypothetical protein
MSAYGARTLVHPVATPERRSAARFKGIGDVDVIANVDAGTIIVTLHGGHAVTADFALSARASIFFVCRRRAARRKRQIRKKSCPEKDALN